MTSPAADAWESILRVRALLLPRLEDALRGTGMSLAWYDALLELNRGGGRLTMGELSERVVLSRSRVSRVVDELESAGWVVRENNSADARSSFAVLTAEGRRRFHRAARVYLQAIDREFETIDAPALMGVVHTLEELLGHRKMSSE